MVVVHASLSAFENLLESKGLKAGLLYLNQRVPYRFTAIYKLDQHRLVRLAFVDKQGGYGEGFSDVPFKDSFCEVAARDGHLMTADPLTDDRLTETAHVAVIGSYVGLPLSRRAGELVGTFCHYDFTSQPVDDPEFEFLQEAIPRLSEYCMRPGMPLGPQTSS